MNGAARDRRGFFREAFDKLLREMTTRAEARFMQIRNDIYRQISHRGAE